MATAVPSPPPKPASPISSPLPVPVGEDAPVSDKAPTDSPAAAVAPMAVAAPFTSSAEASVDDVDDDERRPSQLTTAFSSAENIVTSKEGIMWKKVAGKRAKLELFFRATLWCVLFVSVQGGGTSIFGRTDYAERFFVLTGSMLTYFTSEAEYKKNAAPLKDVAYRMKHCDISAGPDSELKGVGKFAINIVPKNEQGHSRFSPRAPHLGSPLPIHNHHFKEPTSSIITTTHHYPPPIISCIINHESPPPPLPHDHHPSTAM
jgi:hypothetical protein